jgi:DAK2 domain fusion protein YloV
MVAFEEALRIHRDLVNRLNVYPVPDGDTGTNMSLTVEAVTVEIAKLAPEQGGDGHSTLEMDAVCKAIAHGSLMGARGNSGIILCQILRGLAGVFAEHELIRAAEMAAGLEAANTAAREGVMRPVEGTILTVAAAAATAAAKAAADGAELGAALDVAREAAVEALHSTPELLPVLAAAKVVDAGGAGLVLLFDALLHVAEDRPLPPDLPLPDAVREALGGAATRVAAGTTAAGRGSDGLASREGEVAGASGGGSKPAVVDDLRYEVMYLLDAPDSAIPAFKEVWAGLGDSIVVVGGDGLWNCHIHTAEIGPAIEAALDAGRPRDIRVTDLAEQVEEELWVRSAELAGEPLRPDDSGTAPVTSVVVVATGDGIRRIFHSLGVHQVVAGGQSMNPSTAQILELVEAAPSDEVVILPNNTNIFPVAAQVGALTDKNVRVIETAGIQEGFAALLEYDPESGADENAESMRAAADRVVAGEVTRAVRASDSAAGPIEAGDWIGLSRKGIESVAKSPGEAACQLLDKLVRDDHEIVTLIEGHGSSTGETRVITEWLRAERPHVEVERHHGGQPLYPYLLSVE